jgi:DNA-binding MarR family transcriptional regulator
MQHPKIRNSQLIDKIFSTQSLLEKVGNEVIFKKFHITTSLYGTLKMIDAGLHSIGEMKQFTTESPPSLTQKTHKLEKAKFINRKTHPLDKRI